MSWLNDIGGLLQQYTNANASRHPETAEQDFDQLSNAAPRETIAGGLSDAFRSDQTPPFGNMLGQLFGQSSGPQRASVLNTLLLAAGPALSGLMSRGGGSSPLSGLAGLLGGGRTEVTPEEAEQVSPQALEEIAQEAEKRDPSIVDRMSDFYAEHPTLVKSLGAAALAVAMSGMAKQKRGMF